MFGLLFRRLFVVVVVVVVVFAVTLKFNNSDTNEVIHFWNRWGVARSTKAKSGEKYCNPGPHESENRGNLEIAKNSRFFDLLSNN